MLTPIFCPRRGATQGEAMWRELLRREGLKDLFDHNDGATAKLVLASVTAAALLWNAVVWVDAQLKIRRMSSIPVVKGGLPYIGHAAALIKVAPWDMMVQWMHQYGPIYRIKLFGQNCVVTADPALLKEVLHSQMRCFQKDLDFTYKPFMVLLGTGLVTSEGSLWAKQRTMVSAVFRIEILEIIPHIAKRAVERLAAKLETVRGTTETVDIGEMFRHLTLQVIAEAILSISPEESDQTFARMYLPIVTEGNTRTWYPYRAYLPTPSNFEFHRNVKILNDYITSLIVKRWALRKKEREAGGRKGREEDILDRILGVVDEDSWGQAVITQLRDEIKTFVLAGHETSASMLTWALYELMCSQQIMDKVVSEADSVFGKSNGPDTPMPESAELNNLVYTQCCLKEALRKYSVVPIVTRETVKDVTIGGKYFIAAGTRLMVLIQGVHHRDDIWPKADEFQPERFLTKNPEPFTFLPFIDGPRNCLGQYLALLESKIVLATLVQRFRFSLPQPSDQAGRKHPSMVPVIPDDPGLLVLVK